MRFNQTPLADAWVIELDLLGDERGWFARTYDAQEFAARGLAAVGVQCNASFNARRDTLRGLHFQTSPNEEAKLVRCVRGAIWDVAVDLRPQSPSYCRWHAVELTAGNRLGYYIPAGMAHGFQTLSEDCEVTYMMGEVYAPAAASGVRWDDPAFGIDWPEPAGERIIAERDRSYPDFRP
ncbi:MAG: dTDP-4-dehydrorhamnose 3,5-epimerase [Solirubrobacteraceae bacterium]|nr:dTDP-4-dehydrorhamnose 3,5-epimerase [Solirubrobacteraceae bacterium]